MDKPKIGGHTFTARAIDNILFGIRGAIPAVIILTWYAISCARFMVTRHTDVITEETVTYSTSHWTFLNDYNFNMEFF